MRAGRSRGYSGTRLLENDIYKWKREATGSQRAFLARRIPVVMPRSYIILYVGTEKSEGKNY